MGIRQDIKAEGTYQEEDEDQQEQVWEGQDEEKAGQVGKRKGVQGREMKQKKMINNPVYENSIWSPLLYMLIRKYEKYSFENENIAGQREDSMVKGALDAHGKYSGSFMLPI